MDLIVYGRQIRTSEVGTRANRVEDIALRKGIYYATSHVTVNILALILDIYLSYYISIFHSYRQFIVE